MERNHEFYLRDSLQERGLANFLTLFRHHNLHPPLFVLYVPTFLLQLQSNVIQLRGHNGVTTVFICQHDYTICIIEIQKQSQYNVNDNVPTECCSTCWDC